MTKDRRLGKGLAALLGTPVEGEASFDGRAAASVPGSAPTVGQGPSTTRDPTATPNSPVTAEPGSETVKANEPKSADVDTSGSGTRALELSVYEIDNNPFQPRRQFHPEEIASLAESLKTHQQLQPILVRRDGDRYQLISGERRLRAAIQAGMSTVRAEIREADDRLVAELAIIENLQRKDLNAVEKALSFRRYIDQHGCKQDELAQRLKIDRSTIANLMRLLELPSEVLDAIQQSQISAGHARAMLPLGDEDMQRKLVAVIVDEQWSVRKTESHVSELIQAEEDAEIGKVSGGTKKNKRTVPSHIASLEQKLRIELGTKVEIKQGSSGRGKIVVHFSNPEEFERITAAIHADTAYPQVAAA